MTGKTKIRGQLAGAEAKRKDSAEEVIENSMILPFRPPEGRRTGLRRPRLLIAAARHGQQAYRRGRDLRRLMRDDMLPPAGQAVAWLTAREAAMDHARHARLPEWDLQTHILLLIALLHEMQLADRDAGGSDVRPPAVIPKRARHGLRLV